MAKQEKSGSEPNGQDAVSKTVTPQGAGGSNPSASADKPKKVEKKEPLYKLNFRKPNGEIRPDIPHAVAHHLVLNWADLLRIIPANRWSTADEIVALIWEYEARSYRKLYTRTRKQVEEGIRDLVEAGVVISK